MWRNGFLARTQSSRYTIAGLEPVDSGRVVFQGPPEELATAGTETSTYIAAALQLQQELQSQP